MKKNAKIIMAAVLAAAVIAGTLLMAGNVKTETASITVALPIQPWSYWTAFYTAANNGYYAEEGLNVSFTYSQEGGLGVIKQVAAGNAQFGHAGADSLLVARSKNIPVVTIYQDSHGSSWNIIAKNEIKSLKELEGKTIAIQGPNGPPHLAALTMLKKEGVDASKITWVPVGGQAMVSTFLAGKADAIAGNDLYELILRSKNAEFNIWYARNYDADLIAMSPLTTEDMIKNNPKLVEKFLRATKKGEEYAIAHPEEAVEAYIKNFNPSANKDMEIALWKKFYREVIKPDIYALGEFDGAQWERAQEILYELGVMEKRIDLSKAYTAEFLPK